MPEPKRAILKCVNCGRLLYEKDFVVRMRRAYADGSTVFSPCCCYDCADQARKKNMEELKKVILRFQHHLKEVQDTPFQTVPVDEYFNF